MEPARNETQDRIKRWLPTEAEVVRVAVSRPQEKRPGYGYWWPHPRPRFKHTRKRLLPSMAADAEYQVPSIIRQWTAEGVQRTENGLAPRRVRVWYECHTDSMVELARTRRERLVQHLAFHTANAGAWLFGEPHQRGRDTMYQVRLLDYRPRERVWLLNTSRYRQGNATYLAGKDETGYWQVRLPYRHNIEEAMKYLTPVPVQQAQARGEPVLRQGDIYIIQARGGVDCGLDALERTRRWRGGEPSHQWIPLARVLRHYHQHPDLVVPESFGAVRFLRQKRYQPTAGGD